MGIIDIEGVSKRFNLRRSRLYPRGDADRGDDELDDENLKDAEQEEEHPVADRGTGIKWALKDITASIAPGERVAVVGGNGAGKSILLKIIAGLSLPTAGVVRGRGRLVLLHEMLSPIQSSKTGVDNIRIVARMLRVERSIIEARLPEIVAFSGLREQAEQPVRTYSRGMYARLGIAGILHLNPDIMLIDDGVSVGDAAFQGKVDDKLEAVISDGATLIRSGLKGRVLEATCDRALWLDDGRLREDGPVGDVLKKYMAAMLEQRDEALVHAGRRNGANGQQEGSREGQHEDGVDEVGWAEDELPKRSTHRVVVEVTLDKPGTAKEAAERLRGVLDEIDGERLARYQLTSLAKPKQFPQLFQKERERVAFLGGDVKIEDHLW